MNEGRVPTAMERQVITSYVQAGAFPHVAARAVGVPVRCSRNGGVWPGETASHGLQGIPERRPTAHARAHRTEGGRWIAIRSSLRYGPGVRPGELPGWTSPPKAAVVTRKVGEGMEEWQEIFVTLLDALTPFPEARAVLAAALNAKEWVPRPEGKAEGGQSPKQPRTR